MNDNDASQKKQKRTLQQRYRSVAKRLRSAERTTVRHTQKYFVKRLSNLQLVRRQIILSFVALGLVLAGVLAQQFVYSGQYQIKAPVDGGTYVEGVVGTVGTLDPLFASSNAEISARQLLFSSLYSHDCSGTLHPDIARSLSVDKTSKVYTVSLRDDVFWHDGAQLTAEDIAFTVGVIQNPAANVNASLRANWSSIKTEVVDDWTIKFILPNRYAAFPEALVFPIIPKHVLEGTPANLISESDFVTKPIGSGPFKYKLLQVVDSTRCF
jgi:peptide/nickel transport system substrate-binding protein